MVTLEQLSALDLLVWVRTSQRAAQLAGTNQSTISRRTRQVLSEFQLTLLRGSEGWSLHGDRSLLQLERWVHQLARFRGQAPLRLNLPFWTLRHWLGSQPEGWLFNPPEPDLVCENPIALLRDRVIDAALVTPTQLPEAVQDLQVLELYRRPIELTLLPHRGEMDGRGALKLMSFLPHSCCERSLEWFSDLMGSGWSRPQPSLAVAFLTAEMREAQPLPWLVDASFEPYPYVERLVVLAEHATQSAVVQLQEQLVGC